MNTTAEKLAADPTHISSSVPTPWPEADEFRDLTRVARETIRLDPLFYFRSIFGDPTSWLPPHRRFSEYNIIDPWQPIKTARYLTDITVPAFDSTAPDLAKMLLPPIINRIFWRPTSFFRQPDEYGGVSSFPGEHWFFINGVATNHDVARFNAANLAHLFHRPVSVIQNATDSLVVDLIECVIGKGLNWTLGGPRIMTEPAWRATAAILEALNSHDTHRVVVIAHSQGTIVMANVLRAITRILHSDEAKLRNPRWHKFTNNEIGGVETETHKILRDSLAHAFFEFCKGGSTKGLERLAKLEIYTFANCADKMRYVYPDMQVPYMEHFANEFDVVAWLGVLSPLKDDAERLVEIDGPVFEQEREWGHLLNVHYLTAINDYLYPGASQHRREEDPYPGNEEGLSKPRLYEYFHGKQPGKDAQRH